MRFRKLWPLAAGVIALFGTLHAFQRPFREFPGMEYNDFPVPSDYREQTEFVFARLMYPEVRFSVGFGRRTNGDWREGYTYWRIIRAPTVTSSRRFEGCPGYTRARSNSL